VQHGWAHEALIVGKGDKERHVYFDVEAQRPSVPSSRRATTRSGRPGGAVTTIGAFLARVASAGGCQSNRCGRSSRTTPAWSVCRLSRTDPPLEGLDVAQPRRQPVR
jgi:hypothetical protein